MKQGNAGKDQEKGSGCCIEAVLTVDDRGQIVLPKQIRKKAGMKTGDRLALIVWEANNKVCCVGLIKAENLNAGVKGVISPFFE
ncbi:MAG: HgcAB-associated protein [Methanomicrobiales archaeon]|nr:HgcAB-associated protein [Methanomicrobiales archaeon]